MKRRVEWGMEPGEIKETRASDELAFIQNIIDRVPDWVIISTMKAVVVAANEAVAKAIGYTKPEIVGQGLSFFYDRPTIEQATKDLQRVREGGATTRVRPIRTKAGEVLQVELSNSLIHVAGAPHFFVIGRDITHRLEIEGRLRELAAVVRATDMGIVICDAAGFITYANRAAQDMFGYEPSEMVGRPITIFQPPRVRSDYMHQILQATLGGGFRGEVLSMRKSGEEFVRFLVTSPVFDTGGAPVALVGISHDITREKIMEDELKRQAHRVEDLERMTQIIAASAPDVFGRPLAGSVSLLLKALNELPEESPASDAVFLALRSTQKVLHKFPVLVHYTRLRTGQWRRPPSRVEVHPLIERLSHEYAPIARQLDVEFEAQFESDPPPLLGDSELIWGVFVSLVDNALDHTPPGGRVTVRVLPSETVDTVLFSVEDTGPGIAPDSLARLFRTPQEEGRGVGLAFCKLAVEAHDGRIWALGEPGKGSAFYVALPVHPAGEP